MPVGRTTDGCGSDGSYQAARKMATAEATSTIASKNVGDETIVNFGTLTLGGPSASNYTLIGATGIVDVTPDRSPIIRPSEASA